MAKANPKKDLTAQLTPAHLAEEVDPASLRKAIAEEDQPEEEEEETVAADDPRRQREYTFEFSFKVGTGKVYNGKFKSAVPNLNGMQARLQGGMPFESLDLATRDQCFMVAYLEHFLDPDIRPEWASNLEALDHYELLTALYEEVRGHEATFLGRE